MQSCKELNTIETNDQSNLLSSVTAEAQIGGDCEETEQCISGESICNNSVCSCPSDRYFGTNSCLLSKLPSEIAKVMPSFFAHEQIYICHRNVHLSQQSLFPM